LVAHLLLPALTVGLGEFLGGGGCGVGDGGDQGDQLTVAVAVGNLIFDDPYPHRLGGIEMLPSTGGRDEFVPGLVVQGGLGHQ